MNSEFCLGWQKVSALLKDTGERNVAGRVLCLGKVTYVEVRSAGSWKSGNKRTDGPNQIETESN